MSVAARTHLEDDELTRAIADESRLSAAARAHLSSCLRCRSECERLQSDLTRMGQMARSFAPKPTRRPALPEPRAASVLAWLWTWPKMLTAGFAVAALAFMIVGFNLLSPARDTRLAELDKEMAADEQFIAEIAKLEKDALPRVYLDISPAPDADRDEDTTDPFSSIDDGLDAPSPSRGDQSKDSHQLNGDSHGAIS